jgi:hypothetical protein
MIALVGVFAAASIGIEALKLSGTTDQVTFTVKDKERIVDSSGDSKYLVYTDVETFENTDVALKGKFNSSDLQGSLDRGKKYTCEVYGYRMPFFSSYRDLISCKPAE